MLCLFEDHLVENFAPIVATRHLSYLLVGGMTLRERGVRLADDRNVTLHGRGYIRDYHGALGQQTFPPAETTLFLNSRLLATADLFQDLPIGDQWLLRQEGNVVAARLSAESIAALDWSADALDFSALDGIDSTEITHALLYRFVWELIYDNGRRITDDFREFEGGNHGEVAGGAHLVAGEKIAIGRGSRIRPGAILDASDGPIIVGHNVEIMSNAVIVGPCYIGDHSRIKIGAKIYEKTSIGPYCKIGGEVENTIVLGYSNKQHDGFLGHSYLGSWVNLGADTNTSDLKNNYGSIRLTQNRREVDTGAKFLGSLFGDHAKTGINTMLNTGTVVGVAANVFGGGFPPKSIPDYAWGGTDGFERFRVDKAIELARLVMGRRNVEFTEADERLLRYLEKGMKYEV
jgi:UDP-N-acetylglucosamine diphosphorylase/glucosamine-1-phosphate N-acetyltransferase